MELIDLESWIDTWGPNANIANRSSPIASWGAHWDFSVDSSNWLISSQSKGRKRYVLMWKTDFGCHLSMSAWIWQWDYLFGQDTRYWCHALPARVYEDNPIASRLQSWHLNLNICISNGNIVLEAAICTQCIHTTRLIHLKLHLASCTLLYIMHVVANRLADHTQWHLVPSLRLSPPRWLVW